MSPSDVEMKAAAEMFKESKNEPFLKVWQRMEFDLDFLKVFPLGKLKVDSAEKPGKVPSVSSEKIPTWKELVAKLKSLTKEPGAKAQLAADLGTSRQNVNKWLSKTGMPSAELTLAVFRWVKEHE